MSFDGARLEGFSAVKQPRGGEPSVRPFPLSLAVAVAVRAPPLTADASKRRSNYTTSLQLPIAVSPYYAQARWHAQLSRDASIAI